MKIVYIISNFIYSAFALLALFALYLVYFGPGPLPEILPPALINTLDKIMTTFFSEYNIIGLLITYGICLLFTVLTVILLIKNLIKKQNVISLVLSVISIISMIVLGILMVPWDSSISNNPTLSGLAKGFFIFNTVIVAVQFIAAVINEIKIYREEN